MRDSISKSKRFEILKRDGFTCQYCGRKPPVVVLHVDHVVAVINGGQSSDDNLIASCADCNLGKGAKPLDRVSAPINFSVADRQERLEQLQAYEKFLSEQAQYRESAVDDICGRWAIHEGQDANATHWRLPSELEGAARRFIGMLPAQEIIEAIQVAFDRYPTANSDYRFKFFCGVCWRKIRRNQEKKQCT